MAIYLITIDRCDKLLKSPLKSNNDPLIFKLKTPIFEGNKKTNNRPFGFEKSYIEFVANAN